MVHDATIDGGSWQLLQLVRVAADCFHLQQRGAVQTAADGLAVIRSRTEQQVEQLVVLQQEGALACRQQVGLEHGLQHIGLSDNISVASSRAEQWVEFAAVAKQQRSDNNFNTVLVSCWESFSSPSTFQVVYQVVWARWCTLGSNRKTRLLSGAFSDSS